MFAFSNAPQPYEIDASTPFVAASDGDLDLLKQSLAHLSIPVTISDSNGLTLLHSAASYDQREIMEWLLLTQNVNVNAKDNDGDTPLHHCDQVNAARMLIDEGKADYRIKNNEGQTALDLKKEELQELKDSMEEDDENGDVDDDLEALEELVQYLSSLP
jgi:ankyrin repeat protein